MMTSITHQINSAVMPAYYLTDTVTAGLTLLCSQDQGNHVYYH